MKISFITQFLPAPDSPKQTGGTISNLNMLRTLAKTHDVEVLSFDRSSTFSDFVDEPFRVTSRPHPQWSGISLAQNWLSFVRSETQDHINKAGNLDAIIATTSTLASFDACAPTTARIALIRAYENFGWRCPWVSFGHRVNLTKLAAIRHFQDAKFIHNANRIFCNSNFMQRAISDRFGVHNSEIDVLLQACDIFPRNVAPHANTVGFIRRGPEKGFSFVLELARQSPDLHYVVYGHGRDLPASLPSNVEWQGWASDRSSMFASAALWIVPSLWAEPFGRVSIEAQAANRPVLVAENGGLPETVDEELFRIRGLDAHRWISRIRELLNIPPETLIINGKKIREKYSAEQHDARVLGAVARAVRGTRGARAS